METLIVSCGGTPSREICPVNGRYFAIKVKPGNCIIRMTDDKKGYAIDMGPNLRNLWIDRETTSPARA